MRENFWISLLKVRLTIARAIAMLSPMYSTEKHSTKVLCRLGRTRGVAFNNLMEIWFDMKNTVFITMQPTIPQHNECMKMRARVYWGFFAWVRYSLSSIPSSKKWSYHSFIKPFSKFVFCTNNSVFCVGKAERFTGRFIDAVFSSHFMPFTRHFFL